MTLHERVVALVDRALAEGLLERGVGALALGDHHQPGRADVEAVHDALPLGRAGRRDAVAQRPASAADDGRPGPARARMGRDPDRLVDHDDVVVVVERSRSPSTGVGSRPMGLRPARAASTSSQAPALHPVGLAARPAVDGARAPASTRSAAAVRERPNSRATAQRRGAARPARRAPAAAVGRHGSTARSLVAGWRRGPSNRRSRCSARTTTASTAPQHDRRVGEVEDRPVASADADPVDDVTAPDAGRPEDPVDQVAERAAEEQPERDRPADRAAAGCAPCAR